MPNEISDRLSNGSKKIMNLWEIRVQKEIPAAFRQSSLALRNSLPEYLTQIVDALSNTIKRTPDRIEEDKIDSTRVGEKHGRDRGSFARYSIDQLIFEYHILRQTIFQVMEEKEELPKEARDIIIDSIEQAVNDAATEFSEAARDFQEHLAVTVTHDLRTPIAAAKMSAQLMLRKPDQIDNNVKLAHRIVANMDRVDTMVQNLLDSSRVRAGKKLELTFEEMDLILLTTDLCHDLNAIYRNRVKVNSVASIIGYWCKEALWRTLENLITNAAKYGSLDSEIIIKFDRSNDKVGFSVHNSGNPISPDEIGILFEMYGRSREAKGKKGWGVGLSLVKGVVDAHKGKVWVESSIEKGTTFFVELPTDFRKLKQPEVKSDVDLH